MSNSHWSRLVWIGYARHMEWWNRRSKCRRYNYVDSIKNEVSSYTVFVRNWCSFRLRWWRDWVCIRILSKYLDLVNENAIVILLWNWWMMEVFMMVIILFSQNNYYSSIRRTKSQNITDTDDDLSDSVGRCTRFFIHEMEIAHCDLKPSKYSIYLKKSYVICLAFYYQINVEHWKSPTSVRFAKWTSNRH